MDINKALHFARLDWITPEPERVIARHARVSTKNPDREEYLGLLKYCIKEGHVSIFEQVCASFEVYTTRSISAQIIRHRSFSFQETSQRYCNPLDVLNEQSELAPCFELRAQDKSNRQNSLEYNDDEIELKFRGRIRELYALSQELYDEMVASGVARECARNALPMGSPTRLHMQGTLRSWLFYVGVRSAPGTQKEHKLISDSIGALLAEQMPEVITAVIEAAEKNTSLGLQGWRFVPTV